MYAATGFHTRILMKPPKHRNVFSGTTEYTEGTETASGENIPVSGFHHEVTKDHQDVLGAPSCLRVLVVKRRLRAVSVYSVPSVVSTK
jgi:hypothetical protein